MILTLLLLSTVLVDKAVAIYGLEVVTLSEIRDHVRINHVVPLGEESEQAFMERVVSDIVLRHLKLQEVETMGEMEIEASAVEDALDNLARDGLDPPVDPDLLREMVREELILKRYIEKRFIPQVFVSRREVDEVYGEKFKGVPEPPPLKVVEEEIRRYLSLKKLNRLLREWEEDLLSRTEIRYVTQTIEGVYN